MNKVLPRWLQIVLVIAVVSTALFLWLNQDRMRVYGSYLREKSPEVTTRFDALSVSMDEATVRRHFDGLRLDCGPEARSDLGDRVCFATIDKADGDAALKLAVFFRSGRLARAFVQMPWWIHKGWLQRLTAAYGNPGTAGLSSPNGRPVLRWRITNGYVELARERSINPFSLNVVLWTASPP